MMKEFLKSIHSTEEEILNEYISAWEEYSVPKKTIMTREGQTERYMYFVLEGIQKSYHLNEGKEHVIAFTYPPSLSGIPESFLTRTPSKYYLETITESKFLRLHYDKHQQLMEEHRQIDTLFRKAAEAFLVGLLQRHYELMALTIEERFKVFAKRSPHLLNMVAQKDLASYLRIEASNFSKLLGRVVI